MAVKQYVSSSKSYTLKAKQLTLELTGTGNINGTGNSENNTITGNDGNNVINGGAGFDSMTGGLGADKFVFSNKLVETAEGTPDTITDFTTGVDEIDLSKKILTGYKLKGEVTDAEFRYSDAAGYAPAGPYIDSASTRFVYDVSNGKLWYDPDGVGIKIATLVVTLTGAPELHASDIHIV